MKHIFSNLIIFFVSLIIVNSAHSTIIYDTFEVNDSYNPNTAWLIGAATDDPRFPPMEQGIGFTANGSGYLSEITLSLFLFSGSNEIILSLLNDINGQPGDTLESFTISNMLGDFGAPPITIKSNDATFLVANSKYWVIATAPQPDTFAGWGFKHQWIPSNADRAYRNIGDTNWSISNNAGNGALRISFVPEPSTLALLSLGLITLIFIRSKSNRSPYKRGR
jgi:PEP-CTERM motif